MLSPDHPQAARECAHHGTEPDEEVGQVLGVRENSGSLFRWQRLSLSSRSRHAKLAEIELGEVHSLKTQYPLDELSRP